MSAETRESRGPILGVLFDLDNTLYHRDRAFGSWVRWFVREHLGLGDGEEAAAAFDRLAAHDAGAIRRRPSFTS